MRRNVWIIFIVGILYFISSNFFIYLLPPSEEELFGEYTSLFENREYRLNLLPSKVAIFEVKENNNIVYKEKCESFHIEKMTYRTFPIYNLSFNNCSKMDSNAILDRSIFFNIMIGNNGTEIKRIDPDANVYYQK
jgi:hypothetical protein